MLKKLAALICAGMLFLAGMVAPAIADGPKVPIGQQIIYRYNGDALDAIGDWVYETGSPDIWAIFFYSTWVSQHYVEGVTMEFVMSLVNGDGYVALLIPMDDGRPLVLLERLRDGDLIVDAVGRWDPESETMGVYYVFGDEVPSIYSATYAKYMSRIAYRHAYNLPIEHAVMKYEYVESTDGSE